MNKINLLAISVSPRKGNSQYLLEEALKCVSQLSISTELQRFSFAGKKIEPCTGCLRCYKNGGKCIIKDDFEDVRQMWIAADAIIYSSPVYVANIPGHFKSFLDRLHNSFYGYYNGVTSMRHLKAIGFIIQGACMYGGQELAMQTIINHAILINSVPVAPDGSYIGAGGWTGEQNDPKAIEKRAFEGIQDVSMTVNIARNVVQRTVEVAAIIKAGVESLKDVLKEDPRYIPYVEKILKQED